MLLDTGDIITKHCNYLDDYVAVADAEEDETVSYVKQAEVTSAISSLLYKRLFAHLNIADNGAPDPQLLNLWIRNASRLEGKSFPFEIRGEEGWEQLEERVDWKMDSLTIRVELDEFFIYDDEICSCMRTLGRWRVNNPYLMGGARCG